MRASKFLLKLGVALVCCIVFILLSNGGPVAAYGDNDWKVEVDPDRVEIEIGTTSPELYWAIYFYPEIHTRIYFCHFNAPAGITVTPLPFPDDPIYEGGGNKVVSYPFRISIDPSFPSTDEQRVDFFFNIKWGGAGQESYWKTVSLYILPVEEIKWEITKYDPTYTSMEQDENQTIYIGIRNNYAGTLNFDLQATYLHHGFSLPALTGSLALDAGEYYEWTTTLTCTGYGLSPDDKYYACGWQVTNTEAGTTVAAGATIVTYIGEAAENVADLDIWWETDYIEVPFGGMENVSLIMKNIGSQNLSFHTAGFLKITYAAQSPVWIFDYDDPGLPVTLTPDENLTIRFGFWAQGDPETLTKRTRCVVQVEDNWGNIREDSIEMKAIVGTFSVKIRPLAITLLRGHSDYVYIHITNNENANRTYIVDSMELRVEMDPHWATSDPLTDNVEITVFGSRELRFEITALGTEGIRTFEYNVRCHETQKTARVVVSVEITAPIIPIKPGVGGLLALFAPFTGGDLVAAGYLCSLFLLIMPCTITGLAISRGKPGLTVSIFAFMGIIMSVALGLIPSWIFIFILFVIALYLARGSIWGRGGA